MVGTSSRVVQLDSDHYIMRNGIWNLFEIICNGRGNRFVQLSAPFGWLSKPQEFKFEQWTNHLNGFDFVHYAKIHPV